MSLNKFNFSIPHANTKYYYKYESVNRFYTVSSPSASATTQQIPTYTVVFNKNNGSGTMSNQTMKRDQSANLTANAYTKTGYSFAGWNTKADGSGTSYADKTDAVMGCSLGEASFYCCYPLQNSRSIFSEKLNTCVADNEQCRRSSCTLTLPNLYDTINMLYSQGG